MEIQTKLTCLSVHIRFDPSSASVDFWCENCLHVFPKRFSLPKIGKHFRDGLEAGDKLYKGIHPLFPKRDLPARKRDYEPDVFDESDFDEIGA